MRVTALELTDFRSYEQAQLILPAGAVVFIGPNGQGKTNLVEAVQLLSTLVSHRVATDAPLVRSGAAQALVHAVVQRDGREISIDLELNPGRANRARIAGGSTTRARELLGVLRTVMFSPEDLALVRGEPGGRRRHLDDLLVQLAPRLAGLRSDYDRVLKQRNSLLRTGRQAGRGRGPDLSVLEVWDAQLVELGAQLMAHRLLLLTRMREPVAQAYREISGTTDECVLEYMVGDGATWPNHGQGPEPEAGWTPCAELLEASRENLVAELAARRPEEMDRGVTVVGPQRHDLALGLDGLAAKSHASHGESWSIALALKLAALALLRVDDDPVLILDDVFAELDAGRRRRLIAVVAGVEQVLVTAAVPEDVPPELDGVVFSVTKGSVVRA